MFNLPVAVVDGNVNRVIARIFGIHDPINSLSGIKKIKEIAGNILDTSNPGMHNQAIMEFGALQCTADLGAEILIHVPFGWANPQDKDAL